MIAPVTLPEIKLSNGQRVRLRPENTGDEPFLFQLYADTREDELAGTGWDALTRSQFLQSQFQVQRVGYRSNFPKADFAIVLLDAAAVGRIVLHQATDEIRLVDLVVAVPVRNRGIGTGLTQTVLAEASRQNQPVRLHVLQHSPAARLYQRLGFSKIAEHGPYDEMECRPPAMNT
jgi:ribosomal protein S18 acetylase RimI-like enzyme